MAHERKMNSVCVFCVVRREQIHIYIQFSLYFILIQLDQWMECRQLRTGQNMQQLQYTNVSRMVCHTFDFDFIVF